MLRVLALLWLTWFSTLASRLRRGPLRPSWSFGFEWVVRYLRRDWDGSAGWPLARVRAEVNGRFYPAPSARGLTERDGALGGVPVRRFVPGTPSRGVILFLHGGSYVYGSCKSTHRELAASLARRTSAEVVGVEYRLAPEHPYPAQLDDALAAWDALVAERPGAPVALAGDSAGGNLCVALALALRDRGGPTPAALALISPWSDLEMPGRSFVDNDPWDYGTREVLLRQARAFAGSVPLSDPRVSPVHADPKGLPPTLVTVGEAEIPRDDIRALADHLRGAGVEVEVFEAKDMPHNAPVFAAYHPSGEAALGALAGFLERRLG